MSEKSLTSQSLSEIMKMSADDRAAFAQDDTVRDIKLQFAGAYAEVTKRLNQAKKDLQNNLLDVENFDVNSIVGAEVRIKNEENILEILKTRFTVLFPDQKLDIL